MRARTFLSRAGLAAAVLGAALAASLGGGPARAADDDVATQNAKAAVAYFDKYASKAKDEFKFAELVNDLADCGHVIAAQRIGKVLMKDTDEEHKLIAADALGRFRKPPETALAAGRLLLDFLEKGDGSAIVTQSVITSIGDLKYRDAVPKLNEIVLGGGDPYVLLETVRSHGKIGDRRALPALLELWERHPVGYSWETGEVNVDTGASGTADQDAAEAQWNAQYGSQQGHHKKPPVMFKLYVKELILTVKKLTGDDTIELPKHLRAWMEAHREELAAEGIEIPKYKGPKQKDDKGKDGGKGGGKDGKK